VIIPAFAVGRTQELVYSLHSLQRDGAIPAIPIYIDSPLAIDTTTVFEMHPEAFDATENMVQTVPEMFRFPLVTYTRNVEESKALNRANGPMVVIAASGMAEAGRILHHLANGVSDPRNTILIVGFQAEHTLGRRIVERNPVLKILGDEYPLRAAVEVINGYSAHADRTELSAWIDAVKAKSPKLSKVYLVHGEPDSQDEMRNALVARGYSVECPLPHTTIQF
jgi:metallo-beta-lactamase family protein